MKYDRNTMKSLQEAYESVSEDKFYSGKDRNPKTGNPKKISNKKNTKPKDKGIKNQKQLDQMRKGLGAGSDLRDIPEEKVSKNHPNHPDNHEDHPEMTLKDAARIRVEKKTAKKQVESGNRSRLTDKYYPEKKGLRYPVGNKIVPTKKRVDEAIEMSRKDYKKTHKDFKSDDPKNPRVTRYVPGKGTVSTPVKLTDEVEKNCGCGETPCKTYSKQKEVEDMRSLPTRMNLIKTKLRAMGLNMSHELKGKELSEVINYTLNELNRSERETGIDTKTGKPIVKGGTKKPNFPKVSDPALNAVTKGIIAKHGKGAIMSGGSKQQKKVPGQKNPNEGGKYKAMADQKKQIAADAKKRGFDNIQNYVDTMARYGGKKNYDSGQGLGS